MRVWKIFELAWSRCSLGWKSPFLAFPTWRFFVDHTLSKSKTTQEEQANKRLDGCCIRKELVVNNTCNKSTQVFERWEVRLRQWVREDDKWWIRYIRKLFTVCDDSVTSRFSYRKWKRKIANNFWKEKHGNHWGNPGAGGKALIPPTKSCFTLSFQWRDCII